MSFGSTNIVDAATLHAASHFRPSGIPQLLSSGGAADNKNRQQKMRREMSEKKAVPLLAGYPCGTIQ
jgi:hypothetical protein